MKIMKNPAFMFILGVVTCTITTVLASSLIASNISYTPQDKTWGVTNVGAAIDSLKLSKTSDNYSADEKVVGTWMDGKPIYQKTITGKTDSKGNATYGDTTNRVVQPIGTSVDQIINAWGFIYGSGGNAGSKYPIGNFSYVSAPNEWAVMWFRANDNALQPNTYVIATGTGGLTDKDYVLTIQYTKTTD